MKTLPEQFTKNGFTHRLVERVGQWAIYERQHREVSRPHWEVVQITIAPERCLDGRRLPAGEAYPSPSDWGCAGWTYTTLVDAQAKMLGMTPKPSLASLAEGAAA